MIAPMRAKKNRVPRAELLVLVDDFFISLNFRLLTCVNYFAYMGGRQDG